MQTTTQERNALAATGEPGEFHAPVATQMSAVSIMMDDRAMDRLERTANLMASNRCSIPQHLRGSVGDCFAVAMQAAQWGMNPFAVAQKTHLVNGTLGYEAQLVASVINNSGLIQDRFNFEWFGPWEKIVGKFKEVESRTKKDDNGNAKKFIVPAWRQEDEQGLGVKVWATVKGESAPRELTLLMTQARTRNSTLWTEDPKQQIAYLAQKRWARLYAPDVILGVYTPDELVESPTKHMGSVDEVPAPPAADIPPQLMNQAREAADKGMAAYQKFWGEAGPDNRKLLAKEHEGLKARAQQADNERTLDNPPSPAPAPAQTVTDLEPKQVTAEGVRKRMTDAKNEDALNVAADWIGEVDNPAERAELSAYYDQRLNEIRGA